MELGLEFDDSDFSEKVKEKKVQTSYNAKVCYDKWFLSENDDKTDPANVYKFQADYHYYHGDWEAAVNCFNRAHDHLGSQNKVMRREVHESLIRCYIHMRDYSRALVDMDKLISDCVTVDHYCQALMLKQHLYQSAGWIKDELLVLHQLVNLHPLNALLWISLSEVYNKLKHCHGRISDDIQTTGTDICESTAGKDMGKIEDTIVENPVNGDVLEIRTDNKTCNCSSDKDELKEDMHIKLTKETACTQSVCCEQHGSPVDKHCYKFSELNIDKEINCLTSAQNKHICDSLLTLVNGYPLHLVILTCCVRTRLMLQCTQGTVGSFIKDQNVKLMKQADEKIRQLNVTDEQIDAAEQFMRRDMFFEEDRDEDTGTEHTTDSKNFTENGISVEDFNNRWFRWIHEFSCTE